MPRHRWRSKAYKKLGLRGQRECKKLCEIIVETIGIHYRIFGYFIGADMEFILLYPFRKDTDPSYHSACPAAQTRKRETENDPRRSHACQFP